MNICFLLSVILAAALTLAILIPVCDGVEDMKAAKRDLAIIEIAMREKKKMKDRKKTSFRYSAGVESFLVLKCYFIK